MVSSENWSGLLTDKGHHIDMVSGIAPSPDCWLDAFRTLNVDATSAADACNLMSTEYQKFMALELARCHIKDMGRSLFDESTEDYNQSNCSGINYRNHMRQCLVYLTVSAETAYTHFLTYINQLCIRLSREVVMDQFYHTSVNLSKAASEAECQLKDIITQQQAMWTTWNERDKQFEQYQNQLEEYFEDERVRWTREFSHVQSQWQREQETWLMQQNTRQKIQMDEIRLQQQLLAQQKEQLIAFSEAIAQTHQSIQPWSITLDKLFQNAHNVYLLFQAILHFAGNVLLLWLFTYLRCLRWLRQLMLMILVVGGLAELILLWNLDNLTSHAGENSRAVRSVIAVLEITIFMIGVLLSPCLRQSRSTNSPDYYLDQRRTLPADNGRRSAGKVGVEVERHRTNDHSTILPSSWKGNHGPGDFAPHYVPLLDDLCSLQSGLFSTTANIQQNFAMTGHDLETSESLSLLMLQNPHTRPRTSVDEFHDFHSVETSSSSSSSTSDNSPTQQQQQPQPEAISLEFKRSTDNDSVSHRTESATACQKRQRALSLDSPVDEPMTYKRTRVME